MSNKTQVLDPADKQLLKPLSALGKASLAGSTVSFLRRTEYTSSQAPQHFANATSNDLHRLRNDPKRQKIQPTVDKDDPVNILRNIAKGFDVAYPHDAFRGEDSTVNIRGAAPTDAEIKAWSQPKHPSKPDLQLLDSYPLLPDLDALPTNGAYMIMKFISNPLGASETYDHRLDAGILRPLDDPVKMAEHHRKMAEWDSSTLRPQPIQEPDYDLYVPSHSTSLRGIKRKFDVNDPDNEDPELYTEVSEAGSGMFKYDRIRTYETYNQTGNPDSFYNDSVALALHDPEADVGVIPGARKRLSKAAYFYPIVQRTGLRPKRKGTRFAPSQVDEERIDELNVTVGDLAEDFMAIQQQKKADLDPSLQLEAAPAVEAAS